MVSGNQNRQSSQVCPFFIPADSICEVHHTWCVRLKGWGSFENNLYREIYGVTPFLPPSWVCVTVIPWAATFSNFFLDQSLPKTCFTEALTEPLNSLCSLGDLWSSRPKRKCLLCYDSIHKPNALTYTHFPEIYSTVAPYYLLKPTPNLHPKIHWFKLWASHAWACKQIYCVSQHHIKPKHTELCIITVHSVYF